MNTLVHTLMRCLKRRVARPALEQFDEFGHDSWGKKNFRKLFTMAGRKLGSSPVCPTEVESSELKRFNIDWPLSETLDELGRVWLVISASAHLPGAEFHALLLTCYEQGDYRERRAVLRALPLLPKGERFVSIAVDACRSHVQPIFEAVVCENPYPAAHFPERSFNQMVLKALFTGVALNRLIGLDARVTPELTRMAKDYACERRAAGRSVPADIERLIT